MNQLLNASFKARVELVEYMYVYKYIHDTFLYHWIYKPVYGKIFFYCIRLDAMVSSRASMPPP